MNTHPSLSAPFVDLPSLVPKRKMGRNERCWCNSGEKWKVCHKDRELEQPMNIYAHLARVREELVDGYCSHPDTTSCSQQVVKAHTIQRSIGLAAISECGHVLTPDAHFDRHSLRDGKPDLRRVGVNKASTFPGFCDKHDGETFREIEAVDATLTLRSIFLLSYRAIAFERFRKAAILRAGPLYRRLDCGLPFERQAEIQDLVNVMRAGQERGLSDLDDWKTDYDARLMSGNLSGFHGYGVLFAGVLPAVAAGAWHVEYDFSGRQLQKLAHGDSPLQHVAFNLTVVSGNTLAAFGWVGDLEGPSKAFVDSFRSISVTKKANALVRLSFEHLENVYVRPSWWERLNRQLRMSLQDRISSGLPGVPRGNASLRCDGMEFVAQTVKDELCSW